MTVTEHRGPTYAAGHKQLAPYPTVLQMEMKGKPVKAGAEGPKEELRAKPGSPLKTIPEEAECSTRWRSDWRVCGISRVLWFWLKAANTER